MSDIILLNTSIAISWVDFQWHIKYPQLQTKVSQYESELSAAKEKIAKHEKLVCGSRAKMLLRCVLYECVGMARHVLDPDLLYHVPADKGLGNAEPSIEEEHLSALQNSTSWAWPQDRGDQAATKKVCKLPLTAFACRLWQSFSPHTSFTAEDNLSLPDDCIWCVWQSGWANEGYPRPARLSQFKYLDWKWSKYWPVDYTIGCWTGKSITIDIS